MNWDQLAAVQIVASLPQGDAEEIRLRVASAVSAILDGDIATGVALADEALALAMSKTPPWRMGALDAAMAFIRHLAPGPDRDRYVSAVRDIVAETGAAALGAWLERELAS